MRKALKIHLIVHCRNDWFYRPKTVEVNGYRFSKFYRIYSFVFSRRKKVKYVNGCRIFIFSQWNLSRFAVVNFLHVCLMHKNVLKGQDTQNGNYFINYLASRPSKPIRPSIRLNHKWHMHCFDSVLGSFLNFESFVTLACCVWSVRELPDFIKNLLKG